MWKFKSWKGKDKWLFLAALGAILCILAFPVEQLAGRGGGAGAAEEEGGWAGGGGAERPGSFGGGSMPWGQSGSLAEGSMPAGRSGSSGGDSGSGGQSGIPDGLAVSAGAGLSYEEALERRIQELLRHVDGVGQVDVMVVLKASAEKVIHRDESITSSLTEEEDGNGIRRKSESREESRDTVLSSGSGQNVPVVQKELYPEISGIIISASGGGSPSVQAEISAAMEALFGLPPHKIKVLKRVE